MCSSKDLVTSPFVRFNLTEVDFKDLRVVHDVMNCSQPKTRSCDEMPFFDWEAKKLAKIFDHFKDDEALCGLVAAMMQCVHEEVERTRKKTATKVPTRVDTMGMFF